MENQISTSLRGFMREAAGQVTLAACQWPDACNLIIVKYIQLHRIVSRKRDNMRHVILP